MPNVSPGPIIGTQWVKAPAGSKFKLDYVVTENATDPNVPVVGQARAVQRLSDGCAVDEPCGAAARFSKRQA